ncbi:MAG: GatB/YqeY domain-containing protein [Ruminococcaceae bacterium]|nr:GatB/YqeY domain-containing protein [Oscillospiraceae bacterium]
MDIKETLMQDLKYAMKDKDTIRKNTVTMIRSAILQFEKDNLTELDEEGVLDIIAKELKKRRDVLPEYEKSGRDDLIGDIKREIEILLAYLPKQLTMEELEVIVSEAIAETGATSMKDMGKIMATVMPKTKGRADGKMINAIVKEKLS